MSTTARQPDAVERHPRIDALAGDWDALADRVGASPFVRPGWIAAWVDAFGTGALEILTLRRDSRLVAVLPMERIGRRVMSPTNWETPVFGPVYEDLEALRTILQALFAGCPRRVELKLVDAEDQVVSSFRQTARETGYRLVERTVLRSPYLDVHGDWEAEIRRLSNRRRSALRRNRRRLARDGELSFTVVDDAGRLDELLEEAFRVEALGWKGQEGSAILSRPAVRRFYTNVARWAAGRGMLRLAFLRVDGRPVAFDYCLEEGRVHYMLKTSFDPAYSRYSPGIIVRESMVERVFALGLKRYEFLGGAERYKLEWTDTLHERKLIQAFRSSVAGQVDWAATGYGRWLVRGVGRRLVALPRAIRAERDSGHPSAKRLLERLRR